MLNDDGEMKVAFFLLAIAAIVILLYKLWGII